MIRTNMRSSGRWSLVSSEESRDSFSALTDIRRMINQLRVIVNAKDTGAICDLKDTDFTTRMKNAASDFQKMVMQIEPQALQIAGIIGIGVKPDVCTDSPSDPVPDPSTWTMRDYLHWKRTGKFVKTLIEQANGDPRFLAYAYGFACSYAGDVCGSPYVGSSVGGPPRTQWWRHRFVNNYVDTWVFGYYKAGATMNGDDPTPPYNSWPDLCNTSSQARRRQTRPVRECRRQRRRHLPASRPGSRLEPRW